MQKEIQSPVLSGGSDYTDLNGKQSVIHSARAPIFAHRHIYHEKPASVNYAFSPVRYFRRNL
jgi:hypothetical protein